VRNLWAIRKSIDFGSELWVICSLTKRGKNVCEDFLRVHVFVYVYPLYGGLVLKQKKSWPSFSDRSEWKGLKKAILQNEELQRKTLRQCRQSVLLINFIKFNWWGPLTSKTGLFSPIDLIKICLVALKNNSWYTSENICPVFIQTELLDLNFKKSGN
jgi:hypothetical protein